MDNFRERLELYTAIYRNISPSQFIRDMGSLYSVKYPDADKMLRMLGDTSGERRAHVTIERTACGDFDAVSVPVLCLKDNSGNILDKACGVMEGICYYPPIDVEKQIFRQPADLGDTVVLETRNGLVGGIITGLTDDTVVLNGDTTTDVCDILSFRREYNPGQVSGYNRVSARLSTAEELECDEKCNNLFISTDLLSELKWIDRYICYVINCIIYDYGEKVTFERVYVELKELWRARKRKTGCRGPMLESFLLDKGASLDAIHSTICFF